MKNEEMTPELYKIHREDEASYISMYQKHNADNESFKASLKICFSASFRSVMSLAAATHFNKIAGTNQPEIPPT
jgi:hypothetical protein